MDNERSKILSIDIGGASCKVGLVDSNGEVTENTSFDTEDVRNWGPDGFVDRLSDYEKSYSIDAIALGIPATVDWDHNHVRSECDEVPWLTDSSNKKLIQDRLSRPVLLVNDVEAHLVGEWIWGELKGLNSGVMLSLGASMGSALLWSGEPQQGRRGSIMELEHLSLETYGEVKRNRPPGSSTHWLSGRGLTDKIGERGDVVPLPEFFKTDSEPYVSIRKTFEDKMAHLLSIIVMMLDPERIVLAGGLTKSHEQWLPPVKDKMDNYIMDQFKGLSSITLARLRGRDVIKGPAAFWDWQKK